MKKRALFLVSISALFLLASCTTTSLGKVGELPDEWWILSRGQIERKLRADGDGYYANVLVFIGHSDSSTNYSASHAIRNATLNAQVQLSQYLIGKVTDVIMNTETVKENRNSEMTKDVAATEEITRLVQNVNQIISSAITTSQFSSLIIEATHTAKVETGIPYFEGWVCATIQDSVVKETQKIQEEAFNSVIQAAGAYAPVMEQIQKESTDAITEVITMELTGKNQESVNSTAVSY